MSPEGRRLARAYLRAQGVLGAVTEERLRRLWPLLVSDRIEDTADMWVEASAAAVVASHERSTDLAGGFYRRFREVETGDTDVEIVRPAPPPARRQLLAAGPGLIRSNLASGLDFSTAAEKARYWAVGAGSLMVLNGSRETLRSTSSSDRRAEGWARAANADACAFCAMLASRGPVFGSEQTASFQAHVNCACYPVPVFSRSQGWPDNSDRYRQEWTAAQQQARNDPEFASSGTNNDALNNFRRYREGATEPLADTA